MAPDTKPKVLLSFDEAHSLTSTLDGTASDKVLLNYLAEALNELCPQALFALFLSTQYSIEHFAPSYATARSARIRQQIPDLNAPITETPFDCFDMPIHPGRLMAGDPSDIAFMSLFGRPL
jgi:hypothetical protein